MQASTRLYARGEVCGEDTILLDSEELADRRVAKSINYLDVFALVKADVQEVCRNFPEAKQRMRRAQIRTAVLKKFIHVAKRIQKGKSLESARVSISWMNTFSKLDATSSQMQTSLPEILDDQNKIFEELVTSMRMRIMNKQQILMEIVSENVRRDIDELREEIAEIGDE
mmetsp:Transcript_42235/g.69967  ORF Transcript_42235/g.69967 Transcript_42235/m.69967 type:complete len:170 (+) Transcript_42235:2-511(+)